MAEEAEKYDLDTSALDALDKFRAEKAAEEAQLLKFTQSASRKSGQRSSKKSKAKDAAKPLTKEEEEAEEAKAEAALLAEIEAIADLERLNGVAPDSADSMLANLASRLETGSNSGDEAATDADSNADTSTLDVDTFRKTFGESWQLSQFCKTSFVYYNLHEPEAIPAELLGTFDVLVADPPFLNVDTQTKVATTAKLLAKPDAKILLCTGESIADEATKLYGEPHLQKLDLVVEHHGLANAFGIWGRT
ncbi:hypothetical protein L1887_54146 [Cichorium endivia]|nr:hypothetical protein L1887_54146 [Cichorium endivia]